MLVVGAGHRPADRRPALPGARGAAARGARRARCTSCRRELSGALIDEQVAEIGARSRSRARRSARSLLSPTTTDALQAPVDGGERAGASSWRSRVGPSSTTQPAGLGTDTLPAQPLLYLPLTAPMRVRGVLAVAAAEPTRSRARAAPLLDTLRALAALALERVHSSTIAQSTPVQMESERLRSSLLAAVSHDLRTPLAAMSGGRVARATHAAAGGQRRELAESDRARRRAA